MTPPKETIRNHVSPDQRESAERHQAALEAERRARELAPSPASSRHLAQAIEEERRPLRPETELRRTQERRAAAAAPSALDRFRARILRGDDIKTIPKPAPLIDGFLTLDSTAVVYGPSSAGKTFVLLSVALSVSTGSWWFGRKVEPGPVLYIAAESPSVLGERVGAWQEHENVPLNEVDWYPDAVSLLDPVEVATVAAYAKEIRARAVIFDTLARCMVGGDENSGRDMGMVVAGLDAIREACGGCVLVVHHTGKDAERGSRGHSSLRAAVDTELEVRGGDGQVTVLTRKQRAGAEPEPLDLRLVPAGDSMALAAWQSGSDGGLLPAKALEALVALASIEVDGGVSTGAWRTTCDLPERSFYRARKALLDADKIRNVGTDKQPKYLTTATATATADDCHVTLDTYCQQLPHPYGVAVGSVSDSGEEG